MNYCFVLRRTGSFQYRPDQRAVDTNFIPRLKAGKVGRIERLFIPAEQDIVGIIVDFVGQVHSDAVHVVQIPPVDRAGLRVEMIDLNPGRWVVFSDRFQELARRDSPVVSGKRFCVRAREWGEISENLTDRKSVV